MNSIFDGCNELEYLDLSNFDTSNVTNMVWMFADCFKLKIRFKTEIYFFYTKPKGS